MTRAMEREHAKDVVQVRLRRLLDQAVARHGGEAPAGEAIGYKQPSVSLARSGQRPISFAMAAAIAKDAGVSLESLYDSPPRNTPAQPPAPPQPTYEIERRPAKREQLALARAFKDTGDRVTDEDFYAVQEVLRTGESFLVESEEELVEGMRAWLYGAAELRRMERPVTYAGIAWALATPRQREADAARSEVVNREGREELAKLGVERPRVPVRTPARPLPAAIAAPVKTPPRGTPAKTPKTVKRG